MRFFEHIAKLATGRAMKLMRRRGFLAAAAVVVFATTYMLILPAITAGTETYCGLEEHRHGDACYETVSTLICSQEEREGHTHTDSCYTDTPLLTCLQEESEGHKHDDSCYDEEGKLICQTEESEGHSHGEQCYTTERQLTCGQEEDPGHTHGEACYQTEQSLVCTRQEHTHTAACYSNTEADVENEEKWTARFKELELTGVWSEDLLAIAKTQLGYQESTENFIIDENGARKGYTRYGDWYGSAYGDWCAMFVSFCANYADIPRSALPIDCNCQNWIDKLNTEELKLYYAANDGNSYRVLTEGEDYTPQPGDLIFFNWDENPDADHVGLVAEIIPATADKPAQIKTIEGNSSDSVAYQTYSLTDQAIMGYGRMPVNPDPTAGKKAAEEAEKKLSQTASCGDYTVTLAYSEAAQLPAGALLTVDAVSDESSLAELTELLAGSYQYTDKTLLSIRFVLDGQTYTADTPVDVDITVKNPDEETDSGLLLVRLTEEGPESLRAEAAGEDGLIHYQYSQPALTNAVLLTQAIQTYTLSYEGPDYAVTASFTDEAKLPENVELAVTEILGDELQQRCDEIANVTESENIQYVRVFDICFMAEGVEYEPEAPVQVQIIRKDLTDLTDTMEPGVVHFGEDSTEYIESQLTTDEDGTATFEFEGQEFSSFASYVSDPFAGQTNTPSTIATVDTKAIGLTINMFDYWGSRETPSGTANNQSDSIDRSWTNDSRNYVYDGVNAVYSSHDLLNNFYFSASGATFSQKDSPASDAVYTASINAFTGGENGTLGPARQGIVNSTLTNGYPTLATSGHSLDYLFNTENASYKRTYANLNHLFKDLGDGYISYSSDENYAYLDKTSGNFKVYSTTYQNADKSMIGFFPFNEYNTNYTEVKGPCTDSDHPSQNHYNHHFGLTLSGSFIIPENKQVEGQDMCFKFSGDDDMWLYIDGVLVMDIGGIHQPCSGEVNFKTGMVTISDAVAASPGASTTMGTSARIADLFAAAGKTWDDSVDSVHTIQVFYLERGGCYSNLTMTMNLPLYTETHVAVTKAIEGEYADEYSDEEFTFQIMAEQTSGSGVYAPYVGTLTITDKTNTGETNTRTVQTDENGLFTIKPGETATTADIFYSTKRYYVNEIGVDGTKYETVRFNGTESVQTSKGDGTFDAVIGSVAGNKVYAGTEGTVTNVPRMNYTELSVNKSWYDGNDTHANDTVRFRVIRTDENGNETVLEYDGASEFELNAVNNWSKTFEKLPASTLTHTFTYRVEELELKEGYTVHYTDPVVDEEGNTTITISNEPDYHLTVQKKWYRSDGVTEMDGNAIGNSGIQVQLYRSYYRPASDNSHTVTFKLGKDVIKTQIVGDGGSISFRGTGGNNSWNNISGATISGGSATVTDDGNWWNKTYTVSNITSDITVTLTYSNSITANQAKSGFNVTESTAPTQIPGVEGEEAVGSPVTLNKSNNWSYSWGKLETPLTSSDGISYKYYVREVGTSNAYSVSYENNFGIEDGTMIVKNTVVEYELPDTGGIGTIVYTLGGTALMLSALIVYGFSLRRRRERRNE